MSCKSYLMDALMSTDIYMNSSGCTCPPYRANTAMENGNCYNAPIQTQNLLYGKEFIKQTMINQEAILMDQVAELHRLYKLQTDRMDEFRSRRQLHGDFKKLGNSIQNPLSSEISSDNNSQKLLNIPRMPFSSSSITFPDIIQQSSSHVEGLNLQTSKKLADSKGKKKMFDLSLPASEYIDCEEIELFEKELVYNAHEALNSPDNKVSDTVYPFHRSGKVKLFCTGDVLIPPESSSSKIATFFDLNEPFQPEEVDIPSASFQGLLCNSHTRSDVDVSSKKLDKGNPVELPTGNDESGKQRSDMIVFGSKVSSLKSSCDETNEALQLPISFPLNHSIASWDGDKNHCLEASDRKDCLLKEKAPKRKKTSKTPKSHVIIPYNPNPVTMRAHVQNVERRPIAIQALPCFRRLGPESSKSHMKKKCKSSWNFITPGDLEAPISPENEESSRPRGDSTEKEIETVANGHLSKEEVKLAAEALVSISSSKVEARQKKVIGDSAAPCNADSLHLFAGVATSKDGLQSNSTQKNDAEGLDYFEMMTLAIPGTEVNKAVFVRKENKEADVETSLTHKTLRKGRGSLGKQLKSFQTELLPSMASLSRQEVNEDIQAIENVMTVTSVSKKKKGLVRGRKRKTSNTNVINLYDELKRLEEDGEMGSLGKGLPSWGKVTRRRRRPRFPATNPRLIV